ncbi:hypothetical protein V865_004452 [Kwoniella europaea PYCC6329]|uniref:Uncharacterized protein n=1 Tax=Kwoniella europaea PYCC6329 TaxID=1423913 RepID=A0AAX4KIQ9_9TREE
MSTAGGYTDAHPTDDEMFKRRYVAIQDVINELEDENNLIAYRIAKMRKDRIDKERAVQEQQQQQLQKEKERKNAKQSKSTSKAKPKSKTQIKSEAEAAEVESEINEREAEVIDVDVEGNENDMKQGKGDVQVQEIGEKGDIIDIQQRSSIPPDLDQDLNQNHKLSSPIPHENSKGNGDVESLRDEDEDVEMDDY